MWQVKAVLQTILETCFIVGLTGTISVLLREVTAMNLQADLGFHVMIGFHRLLVSLSWGA